MYMCDLRGRRWWCGLELGLTSALAFSYAVANRHSGIALFPLRAGVAGLGFVRSWGWNDGDVPSGV